jgi:hypothetical protein
MKEKWKPHVDQNKEIMNDLNYVGSSLSILFLPSVLESVKLLVFSIFVSKEMWFYIAVYNSFYGKLCTKFYIAMYNSIYGKLCTKFYIAIYNSIYGKLCTKFYIAMYSSIYGKLCTKFYIAMYNSVYGKLCTKFLAGPGHIDCWT